MVKKLLFITLSSAIAVTCLTGCGNNDNSTSSLNSAASGMVSSNINSRLNGESITSSSFVSDPLNSIESTISDIGSRISSAL